MKSIKGDLDILGLASLLQMLTMNESRGTLTVFYGGDRKIIYFGRSGIRLLSSTMRRVNKLGKILVRQKKMSRADLEALLSEQKQGGWRLGKIVLKKKLATVEELKAALQEQLEEEFYDMFLWENATFEFIEGNAPKEKADNPLAGLKFEPKMESLILEAARRVDELKQIRKLVSDENAIVAKTGKPVPIRRLGPDREVVVSIFPLVNSIHTVREIVGASVYPRYRTLRGIYFLIRLGCAKMVRPTKRRRKQQKNR